jgi:hypothetical protein
MVFYAQTDSRWSSHELGFNTDPAFSIGNYGCVITAVGNLMVATSGDEAYTPEDINNWGKANGGFVQGGGIWVWSAVQALGHVTAAGTTTDINAVNAFLQAEPNFAILEVRAGTRQHFVMAPYVNKIIDSEDGQLKSMSTFPFVSAHLYTAVSMPTPAAPPTSGPLDSTVTIRVPLLNARTEPNTSSAVVAQFHAGYAHTSGWTVGDTVTVGGRTDNIWLKSDAGHWFAQAGCDSNFGHLPARLTPIQTAHLVASEATGGLVGAFNKIIRKQPK